MLNKSENSAVYKQPCSFSLSAFLHSLCVCCPFLYATLLANTIDHVPAHNITTTCLILSVPPAPHTSDTLSQKTSRTASQLPARQSSSLAMTPSSLHLWKPFKTYCPYLPQPALLVCLALLVFQFTWLVLLSGLSVHLHLGRLSWHFRLQGLQTQNQPDNWKKMVEIQALWGHSTCSWLVFNSQVLPQYLTLLHPPLVIVCCSNLIHITGTCSCGSGASAIIYQPEGQGFYSKLLHNTNCTMDYPVGPSLVWKCIWLLIAPD